MRKKLLVVLLSAVMVVSMMPLSVFAQTSDKESNEDYTVTFVGNPAEAGQFYDIDTLSFVTEIVVPNNTRYYVTEGDISFDVESKDIHTVAPISSLEYVFTGWEGLEPGTVGRINANTTFVANYENAGLLHTVTFNSNNGEMPKEETVLDGYCVEKPADPEFEGHEFLGWFEDGATESFDFDTPITSDLTLTAHWTPVLNTHTVEFRSNLGFPFGEPQVVEDGQCAQMPKIPESMRVERWYTYNGEEEVPFDFSMPITEDMTVYGETTLLHTVKFMVDGSLYEIEQVGDGEYATCPKDPQKEGYKFNGWYIDQAAAGSSFDFENTPITENTILYADWIENDTPEPTPVPPGPTPKPTPPVNPVKPTGDNHKKGGMTTGDDNMVILFAGLGAVAIATAIVIGLRRKQH